MLPKTCRLAPQNLKLAVKKSPKRFSI